MLGSILIIAIVLFGFSIMIGGKGENLHKFLIWLVLGPFLVGFMYCTVFSWWTVAPLWVQILSVLLVLALLAALLRVIFPKAKWLDGLLESIMQILIYLVTFPFRLIWRSGRFAFQKERQIYRLDPYRPVVGGRPPLEDQGGNPRGAP